MEQEDKAVGISVVIPVFKVSPYVERCLKSVMSQTYDRFECILVDDASPDDSMARCERMIAGYGGPIRFRLLRHDRNRGLSAARNTGTDAASGDYILYLDSDDYISSDCVEKLVAPVLQDRSIEMVLGERMLVSDEGPLINQRNSWRRREDLRTRSQVRELFFDRSRYFPSAAWNKLVSREFIVRHRLRFEEGLLMEDTLWTFYVMKYLSHLYVIPDITYFYYIRPDSIAHGMDKTALAEFGCLVFGKISTDFTPSERDLEAEKYLESFCHFYMYQPKSPENRAAARRFGKALPFRKHARARILLEAARVLPHTPRGRERLKSLREWLYKESVKGQRGR